MSSGTAQKEKTHWVRIKEGDSRHARQERESGGRGTAGLDRQTVHGAWQDEAGGDRGSCPPSVICLLSNDDGADSGTTQ